MKIKAGDELFVCMKINRNSPYRWELATVKKVTQRFFYLDYPPLHDKRIPLETMCVPVYMAFAPTDKERQSQIEAHLRSRLITTLLKTDWGKFETQALQELADAIAAKKLD